MDRIQRILSDICGNDGTKNTISQCYADGRMPHCFLFEGEAGSGKHTLAKGLIRAISDEKFDSKIINDNEIDIKYVRREKDKKSIGVNQIRSMVEKAYLPPSELDYNFIIIDGADYLTIESQNALLKILEEPPAFMKIIMLCESINPILPTVLSRATRFRMERINNEKLIEYLLHKSKKACDMQSKKPDEFMSAIKFANGNIGKALELIEAKKSADEESNIAYKLMQSLCQKDKVTFFTLCHKLPGKREALSVIIQDIELILRDCSLSKAFLKKECNIGTLYFSSMEKCREISRQLSTQAIQGMIFYIEGVHEHIGINANVKLLTSEFANTMWKYANV